MFKRMLCVLAVLALALCGLSSAAAEDAVPVTAAELSALLDSVRAQIGSGAPLNDPAADIAQTEDGTRFRYEAADLYADGTEMTADTPVNVMIFADSEGPVLRSTGIDTHWMDLLAAYPLENPELKGTREQAVLYLQKTRGAGYTYGIAQRDGQRITAVEYGEVFLDGADYRKVSVTYALESGLVTSIRVDGLNPAQGRTDAIRAEESFSDLSILAAADEYRAVKTSRTGTDLAPFGPEDLTFSGITYTALTPDALSGNYESELIDNEDGTWLLRCDGDGWEAVFTCDAEGKNANILSYTILDGDVEGPRCVRLGDSLSDDYTRFRSEGNDTSEDMTELLYGAEDSDSWGLASFDYSAGEASLRYVTEAGGLRVELLLKYEQNLLKEIIVHTL